MDSNKNEKIVEKELDILEEDNLEDEVVIEKPKPKRKNKPGGKNSGENWVMTPKRAEALKKAQIKLKERNEALKEAKMIQQEEERQIIEQKVIAKAIALKKRQLKKEQAIDSIPVDVPMPIRPKKPTVETYVPKYRFL
jgi:hypothetical protein